LVLINFYTQWCGYSTQFAPVYEAAADKINELIPVGNKIVLGRLDGGNYSKIEQNLIINNKFKQTLRNQLLINHEQILLCFI